MKLYIKQAVLVLGGRFTVKDESGTDIFFVEGSFLRVPKQFKIYDKNYNNVAVIDRQMFRLFGHYDINANGKNITLKRHFAFFKQSYTIEGINWALEGNFTNHHYEVVQGKNLIMRLRKHWFTWGDSYELNILDKHDALLALSIAICVDNEIAKDASSNNASTG